MVRAIVAIGMLCAMCQGCMNYLYTGSITALDSASASREVILYWQKTKYLGVRQKGGPLMLLTQCGRPLTFNELGDSRPIAYRGIAGMDRLPGDSQPFVDGTPCAEVTGESSFVEMSEGRVEVVIHCEPLADDEGFSAVATYLQRRPEPYVFPMLVQKKFHWLGGEIEPPAQPPCDV